MDIYSFYQFDSFIVTHLQVGGFGFALTMPDIVLDVLVDSVDIFTVIEVDIGDLSDIKPSVKDVKFRDVGHIDVSTDYFKRGNIIQFSSRLK